MYLHRSSALSNLALNAPLPVGGVKGLFIRYAGTAQAAQTVTLANLGRVRVNLKGTDVDNASVDYFSRFCNLKWGVAEFSSAVGAAFVCSIYVPFHQPEDDQNCLRVANQNDGYVELQFPALVPALIASGTVDVYVVPSKGTNSYIPLHLQQNLQVGGAGQVKDSLTSFNIANIYITEDAAVSNYIVTRDAVQAVNATQAAIKARSNMVNRVETAITLMELQLNPSYMIANAFANRVDVQATTTGAVNIELIYNSILFSDKFTGKRAVETQLTATTRPTVTKTAFVSVE